MVIYALGSRSSVCQGWVYAKIIYCSNVIYRPKSSRSTSLVSSGWLSSVRSLNIWVTVCVCVLNLNIWVPVAIYLLCRVELLCSWCKWSYGAPPAYTLYLEVLAFLPLWWPNLPSTATANGVSPAAPLGVVVLDLLQDVSLGHSWSSGNSSTFISIAIWSMSSRLSRWGLYGGSIPFKYMYVVLYDNGFVWHRQGLVLISIWFFCW